MEHDRSLIRNMQVKIFKKRVMRYSKTERCLDNILCEEWRYTNVKNFNLLAVARNHGMHANHSSAMINNSNTGLGANEDSKRQQIAWRLRWYQQNDITLMTLDDATYFIDTVIILKSCDNIVKRYVARNFSSVVMPVNDVLYGEQTIVQIPLYFMITDV